MNFDWALSPVLLTAMIIIAVAALHASFQLGVSVLTGLHAHGLGKETRLRNLAALSSAYVAGVAFITALLAFALTFLMTALVSNHDTFWWAVTCGTGAGVGVAVLAFYYRSGEGTMLWLPRSASEYLQRRIRRTCTRFEAAVLGMSTVLAELPFIAAPLLILAMLVRSEPSVGNISYIALYCMIAILPLLIVLGLIGSGHKLSHIQRWREDNKRFLQFSAGLGLIAVSLYLFSVYGLAGGIRL